jgi:aminoglycoside phosphotransferase (APT) family kinase protein
MRMHADEIEIDVPLVRHLLAEQFPYWADLPMEPVLPRGTDNALYRLGEQMVARLPRLERVATTLEKEIAWLPRLAPLLPLAVPIPLAEGMPTEEYPCPWAIYTWLEGESAVAQNIADPTQFAADLAGFIVALLEIDPSGGPEPGEHNFFRGVPLAERDADTRASIVALADEIDVEAVTVAWEDALAAPLWEGAPVWIHGDLDARNLLVRGGRLSAVIDFGGLGVGDPACDVMVAWKVFPAEAREIFRAQLGVDEATWRRSRGWALSQALMALSYYTMETNPTLVLESRRWMAEILADRA